MLQLATPYYEELTVRENLTLAAHMKLGGMTWRERFQRVEQVIEVVSDKDYLFLDMCTVAISLWSALMDV